MSSSTCTVALNDLFTTLDALRKLASDMGARMQLQWLASKNMKQMERSLDLWELAVLLPTIWGTSGIRGAPNHPYSSSTPYLVPFDGIDKFSLGGAQGCIVFCIVYKRNNRSSYCCIPLLYVVDCRCDLWNNKGDFVEVRPSRLSSHCEELLSCIGPAPFCV